MSAEVQIGDELKEDSLESKLDAIKAQTTSHKARARLEALKAARGKATESATEAEAPKESLAQQTRANTQHPIPSSRRLYDTA